MTQGSATYQVGEKGGVAQTLPFGVRVALLAFITLVAAALIALCPQTAYAAGVDAGGASAGEDAAVDDAAGFGLVGFVRNNAGTERAVGGSDLGYRYPLQSESTLVVVNTPAAVVVHIDDAAAQAAGFDPADAGDQNALRALVENLDRTHSRGDAVLADAAEKPWAFTTAPTYEEGAYRYRFVVEADGRRYTAVEPADLSAGADPSAAADAQGLDLGDGALWSVNARLVPAADVARASAPTWAEQLHAFFSDIDYRPFWVSLKTSALALVFTFVLGLAAAWRTMGTSSRLKGVLDSVFTIPMVLPPTVCGFLLMLLFGQSTAVGRWLIVHGVDIVFTWPAAVVSAVVVSFPLMYRTALGAFEGLDSHMLDAARTLGWSEGRIFRRLMLPLAWPSIAAGTVLAFARAMGEFGCTLFFAGNYAGVTQTIPIAIYFEWMGGSSAVALFWVAVVIVFSFAVILFINLYTAHAQAYRGRGLTRAEERRLRRAERAGKAGQGGKSGQQDMTWAEGADRAFATGLETEQADADAPHIDQEALRALLGGEPATGASGGARSHGGSPAAAETGANPAPGDATADAGVAAPRAGKAEKPAPSAAGSQAIPRADNAEEGGA